MTHKAAPTVSENSRRRIAGLGFFSRPGVALWFIACLVIVVASAIVIARLPRLRIGDGMEYYGLFFAWTETFRPWMNAISFAAYDRFHEAGSVIGTLSSPDYLNKIFPALHIRETADFNHFWLYSLLAAAVHFLAKAGGLSLGPHQCFVVLHALLFLLLLAIASVSHGRRGFLAVVLITASSPIVWFANKVHTEFFTFCFTVAAFILVMRNQLVAAALFMAASATQNPGLSFVPVVLLAIRVFGDWRVSYSRWEVAGVVATILLFAAHPVYYFARFGVITPQLLAGGAEPGTNLSIAYIWLIDPDVGLFPNWPFGFVLLIGGIFYWRTLVYGESRALLQPSRFWIVSATFLACCVYSHASTTNLNSGGTPGVARYALWYVALMYPFALACVLAAASFRCVKRFASTAAALVFTCAGLVSSILTVNESYERPSRISAFLQRYLPHLYNPPAEIFAERYSGTGETVPVHAVVGPDCKKILILPRPRNAPIAVPENCSYEPSQIENWVRARSVSLIAPAYLEIDVGNRAVVEGIAIPETPTARFTTGWAVPEASHRWSNGASSKVSLLMPPNDGKLCFSLDGFSFGAQTVDAVVDGKKASETRLEGEGRVIVPLGQKTGLVKLTLNYSNPRRPGNGDNRLLAFGFRSVSFLPCPGST